LRLGSGVYTSSAVEGGKGKLKIGPETTDYETTDYWTADHAAGRQNG
jgi:hypothetical protein